MKVHQKLAIGQLDGKIKQFPSDVAVPSHGWVNAIRVTLGMSLTQLATRLGITPPSAQELETREVTGAITLKKLQDAAEAMDMRLVYALVPKAGSLEKTIETKARAKATEIVLRTSNSMKLEDQENNKARIKKAIDEKTEELKREMPKFLWD